MTQSKHVIFSALCLKCSCVRVNSQADRKRARGSRKKVMYTDGAPSDRIMQQFRQRRDGQIMTLEILAIAIGLSTFADEIKGERLFIFSDNVGAEGACREGKTKRWDHAKLVHGIWTQLLSYKTQPWFVRVPTAENISDCPSREVYHLMKKLRGIWRAPTLADLYVES